MTYIVEGDYDNEVCILGIRNPAGIQPSVIPWVLGVRNMPCKRCFSKKTGALVAHLYKDPDLRQFAVGSSFGTMKNNLEKKYFFQHSYESLYNSPDGYIKYKRYRFDKDYALDTIPIDSFIVSQPNYYLSNGSRGFFCKSDH